jgi:hypothetical protein
MTFRSVVMAAPGKQLTLDALAPIVDQVLGIQFGNFAAYAAQP